MLKWLFPPIVLALGMMISYRWPDVARRAVRFLIVAMLVVFASLIVSGCLHEADVSGRIAHFHRWGGQAFIIMTWCFAFLAGGVVLERKVRRHPIVAIAWLLLLVPLVGAAILATLTGFFGPTHNADQDTGTTLRFQLLHGFLMPILIAGFLALWWRLFARPAKEAGQDPSV